MKQNLLRKRKITIVTDSESDSRSETGIANSKYKKKENEDRGKRKGVNFDNMKKDPPVKRESSKIYQI